MGQPNDGKQFKFNIPLSMSLPEILENTGITVNNIIDNVLSSADSNNHPPSIQEMKSFKESIDGFYGIAQTQHDMLGMEKTAEQKKKEFLHVLKLNNNESEYFILDTVEINGGLEVTANVYIGTK